MSGADTDAGSGRKSAHETEPVERQRTLEADPRGAPSTPEPVLVLIAEDEMPIAEVLSMVVADAGYTPVVAAHGQEALELARARKPALLITDLMMPYLDGAQLIDAIRADAALDAHAPPPIVLMTAAGMRRARGIDADTYLRKPFDLQEVDDLLRRFLGLHTKPPLDSGHGSSDPT